MISLSFDEPFVNPFNGFQMLVKQEVQHFIKAKTFNYEPFVNPLSV